jgi:glutamate synthase (NADPH/NADH) large chain
MSGGIAYVFDGEGEFDKLCNKEMVDLEVPSAEDREEIRTLVAKHLEYTGSTPARLLLDDWDNLSSRFVKVMPRDYKAVLARRKAQEAMAKETVVVVK